jgi:secreted trypsin-like serine protease
MRRALIAAASGAAVLLVAFTASAGAQVGPRIVGGTPTTVAEIPWQAALVYDSRFGLNDFQGQFCGGSLITARIVQTAAHCVEDRDPDGPLTDAKDIDDLDVVLGKSVLTGGGGERKDVQKIYIDPAYDDVTLESDFAWIVLTTASAQTPVKIAGPGETAVWQTGRLTATSGWGNTIQGGTKSDSLRVVTVPIISDGTCGQPAIYGMDFDAATMVCAGLLGGGVDSCQGDSGGPLHAPAANTAPDPPFRLVGVTSWGDGCAQANAPGVYGRLPDYDSLGDDIQEKIDSIETLELITDGSENTLVTGTGATPPPPSNDSFATPEVIAPGTSLISNNLDATTEGGEPNHGGVSGGHSVWYSWTAAATGVATVSLCGSNMNTLLGVYTGTAVAALTPVVGNDDGCGSSSHASFNVTEGTNYRIAVDGFLGETGAFKLTLSFAPPPMVVPPPPPEPVKKKKCKKGKKLKGGKCVKKRKKKKK